MRSDFALSASAEMVGYWDPVGKVTNSVEATVVAAGTTTLAGGWYVVTGEVSRAQINVTGTEARPANLILADGAKLTVYPDSDHRAALHVPTGKALSIWATREGGTGAIEATGRYQGAGIGGGFTEDGGTITITGGKVLAIGGTMSGGATGTAPAATRLCVKGGVTGETVRVSERGSLESGVILKEGSETNATLATTCTGKPYLELGKSATITVPQLAARRSSRQKCRAVAL